MGLRQIKGDTWCLEGAELIPLVRLPGDKCVLLDSGHAYEGPALTAALEAAGLTPAGVFCSHVHVDHAVNNHGRCGDDVVTHHVDNVFHFDKVGVNFVVRHYLFNHSVGCLAFGATRT